MRSFNTQKRARYPKIMLLLKKVILVVLIITVIVAGLYLLSFTRRLIRVDGYIDSPNKEQRILDIGTGHGVIPKYLSRKYPNVRSIDLERGWGLFPAIVYDGKRIPFDDNSFDTVYCGYVLHHAFNQLDVLDEMIRVCKSGGRVVIEEDTPTTKLDKILAGKHAECDFGGDIDLFHSPDEWVQIFRDRGLTVLKMDRLSRLTGIPHYPVSRTSYILQVN
jgi:SAM-dependent methyltransferase